MEPLNHTLDTNVNAFVLERLEGIHTRGHHVGLNDLVPGPPRPDIDPQLHRMVVGRVRRRPMRRARIEP
ncbi:hypothetical protein ACFZBU_45795 [Embleya sp. NPDC008237]|uniref:hypothetical protein n=1 Tax=Embleya sp. NPDC008237 TaxID=3363978 RepID=UPI0036EC9592